MTFDLAIPVTVDLEQAPAVANDDLGPSIRVLTDGDLLTLNPDQSGFKGSEALLYGRRVEALVLSRQRELAKLRTEAKRQPPPGQFTFTTAPASESSGARA